MRFLPLPVSLATTLLVAPIFAQAQVEKSNRDWWAYQPLNRPVVPETVQRGWARNAIDLFVLHGLQTEHLSPARPADRLTLLRRATYDLTGLPPTQAEIASYMADHEPLAYERQVERLLASPQYGVKWGRHWLDLVRWAETDSYERDRRKPNAWRYRDWVIDAFNRDKPYDRFLFEQLAGDELPHRTLETMIATGYYHLGIRDDEPTELVQAQYDDLDGILDTTCRVMLGISMGCARCHDHKRDPILQSEYYAMLACFENIKPYKANRGNNVTMMNFVARVPSNLGREVATDVDEKWAADRARLVAEIRGFTTASGVHLDDATQAGIAAVTREHLVAHYAFDSAAGDFAAEVFDASVQAEGRFGAALFFDGGDDYVRLKRPVQDDFTISFWFKTASMGAGGEHLTWHSGSGLVDAEVGGVTRDFGISHHSNGRIVAGTGKPDLHLASPPGYNDDQWHHVVFTRHRGSGRMSLYVDGYVVDTKKGSRHRLDAPKFLNIGRLQTGINYFSGSIDELRIYDRELKQEDVLALCYGEGFETGLHTVLEERLGKKGANRRKSMIRRLVALVKPQAETTEILVVQEKGASPDPSFIRVRGNALVKGDGVTMGVPSVVSSVPLRIPKVSQDAQTSMRRTALATWITDPRNPLTARVMVNRIWQHHFGRGLTRVPNDFGRLGQEPTHPELLTWLAVEFIEQDWSMKAMHRLIMTSSAYRMSTVSDERALTQDPLNDAFWRFDMRRLTAEEIRDSILAVTGALELKMGGPGIYPVMPKEVLATSSRPGAAWGRSSATDTARRSIYVHVKRSLLLPLLQSFDLADTDASCPVRFNTTQPTQSLTMINGDFIHKQAKLFRERLEREAKSLRAQLELGLRLVTQHPPRAAAVEQGLALIRDLQEKDGLDAERAFDAWCLCALNLNEFVYLD